MCVRQSVCVQANAATFDPELFAATAVGAATKSLPQAVGSHVVDPNVVHRGTGEDGEVSVWRVLAAVVSGRGGGWGRGWA